MPVPFELQVVGRTIRLIRMLRFFGAAASSLKSIPGRFTTIPNQLPESSSEG